MCRMFAYLGREPQEVESHFIKGNNALLRQATRNPDGWGVVFLEKDGKIVKEQEVIAAYQSSRFRDLSRQLSSTLVLAHVRFASVGMIVPENVHPFVLGKWIFAHNGSVFKFPLVKVKLLELLPAHIKQGIRGSTDSEYLFALILWEIEKIQNQQMHETFEKSLVSAIRNGIIQMNDLALEAGAHGDSLMNILLTDGSAIWGARFGKPLVYYKDPEKQGVVIASERTDKKRSWKTFPQNTIFAMTPEGQEMRISPLLNRIPRFGHISREQRFKLL